MIKPLLLISSQLLLISSQFKIQMRRYLRLILLLVAAIIVLVLVETIATDSAAGINKQTSGIVVHPAIWISLSVIVIAAILIAGRKK